MAADWTESGRYAGREMQDYERISNSDGGKEKPQRKTHGLRLRMKRDVVPRTEWHSVFRRSSNDRNHKSPQAQKTPVWRPKRWNLAEKRPASWRSYESCSLARFRSENCSFFIKIGRRRRDPPLRHTALLIPKESKTTPPCWMRCARMDRRKKHHKK